MAFSGHCSIHSLMDVRIFQTFYEILLKKKNQIANIFNKSNINVLKNVPCV